jgi:predicted Co/Zn/Cd cation transporter (cation efflux family)
MMLTTLEVSVGGGHASMRIDIGRSTAPGQRHFLGLVAVALVLPLAVLFASAMLHAITGSSRLGVIEAAGPAAPVVGAVALGATLVALAVLVIARVRLRVERGEARWHGQLSVDVNAWEMAGGLAGLVLVGLFAAHLIIDGVACAGGVVRAC